MCGIVGVTKPEELGPEALGRLVDCMARRGPDARGLWADGRVALGHRRLAIMDLSDAGAQPMHSDDGNVVAVYNGECYNHLELRKTLPASTQWRGTCDTETLIRLYEHQGPDFIRQVRGMFALAIYDRRRGEIFIYRDRLGEKPLYYHHDNGRFVFASDLRALILHPHISRDIDPWALRDFLLFNYVPGPHSMLRSVQKLQPGTMLRYTFEGDKLELKRWWSVDEVMPVAAHIQGLIDQGLRPNVSLGDATLKMEALLESAVREQTLADVPLGCFLSGGIDSSLIAALLSQSGNGKVRTYTIAFREPEFDESAHARQVATHLETEHTELTATAEDCLKILPQMPTMFSEPFADASLLPTALLCRLTRQHVTVALSGDGGDEVFLGYDRYRWADKVAWRTAWLPEKLRMAVAKRMEASNDYRLQMIGKGLQYHGGKRGIYPQVFALWNQRTAEELARPALERNLSSARTPWPIQSPWQRSLTLVQEAASADLQHYLPDDILVKVDRCAMHHSLETRAPFLDHRVVELALSLPEWWNYRFGIQKKMLRDILFKRVPERFFQRPKAGFAVPLRHWFRNELRGMLEESLAPSELKRHGLIDATVVRGLLDRHFSGNYNHERQLFALLAFQLWHAEYLR